MCAKVSFWKKPLPGAKKEEWNSMLSIVIIPKKSSRTVDFPRKLKVDLFIDDRNLGGLPDWGLIYQMIKEHKTFRDIYTQGNIPAEQDKKKKWWF